jgi:hypothetical protein
MPPLHIGQEFIERCRAPAPARCSRYAPSARSPQLSARFDPRERSSLIRGATLAVRAVPRRRVPPRTMSHFWQLTPSSSYPRRRQRLRFGVIGHQVHVRRTVPVGAAFIPVSESWCRHSSPHNRARDPIHWDVHRTRASSATDAPDRAPDRIAPASITGAPHLFPRPCSAIRAPSRAKSGIADQFIPPCANAGY